MPGGWSIAVEFGFYVLAPVAFVLISTWRKALAIGGFALGTFGLGFTLGGLIFGRWRKA